ncbi:MAG: hypothetical protein JRJ25_01430 [Deltaproteobacteria bacterium]|nr:hypothetical protein [Deltaproteobacteria bacterium]
MATDDNNTKGKTSVQNEVSTVSSYVKTSVNRLVGTKVDATTAKVTSPSDPSVHVTVKVFHPSMLLAD